MHADVKPCDNGRCHNKQRQTCEQQAATNGYLFDRTATAVPPRVTAHHRLSLLAAVGRRAPAE
jgi:hypothetical protein